MASNINPYNINGSYPVAGQDNSSQGFRDNFTNIKNNFVFASSEISDLQSKAILTGALNGQTLNNDMAGTQIRRPQLSSWTQSLVDLGVIGSNATLDFSLGNFQKITTGGAISISFANWPTLSGGGSVGYGILRLWLVITDVSHTMTLPSNVTVDVSDIAGYNSSNRTITFDQAGSYVFDFSSVDGGNNYLITDITRNCTKIRGNAEVTGSFQTDAGRIEAGTYVATIPTTGGYFSSNLYISSLVVDSTNSAIIAWANITLPQGPANGQRIKITSIAPITNANINTADGSSIKYVATNKYSSGNTAVLLTYLTSYNTWYLT
jgi:hypothetical protein